MPGSPPAESAFDSENLCDVSQRGHESLKKPAGREGWRYSGGREPSRQHGREPLAMSMTLTTESLDRQLVAAVLSRREQRAGAQLGNAGRTEKKKIHEHEEDCA